MCLMMSLQVTGIRGRPGPMVSICVVCFTPYHLLKRISSSANGMFSVNIQLPELTLDGIRGQLPAAQHHFTRTSAQRDRPLVA